MKSLFFFEVASSKVINYASILLYAFSWKKYVVILGLHFLGIRVQGTAQIIKFSIKDFFCTFPLRISRILRIWPHLLKKYLMKNFI